MDTIIEQLVGQGVLGIFLIIVIWYFKYEIKHLRKEFKGKSTAHAESMKIKDDKIQSLNDQTRTDAIANMTYFNNVGNQIEKLVIELKIRNNGKGL